MIAIRSPDLAMPWLPASAAQSSSSAADFVLVVAVEGGDPEEQVEPAHGLDPRRDRQHRDFRAVGGDEPGGAAAVGRHDQRRQPEPVDRADRALGDRVGDVLGRLVGAGEEPLAVGEVGLGRPRDPVHHPHRLDRVGADRGLLGEHHRVGAVVDRVGDVGHLGPGRPPRGHHRGQHLGRRDRRLRALAGGADQTFLDDRHLGQRQLDPEVAAGDHDPAGRGLDDLLGVLGGLPLLDLRDQRDVGVERAQPLRRRARGRRRWRRRRPRAGRCRARPRTRPSPGRRRSSPARSRRGRSSPCGRRASRRPRPRTRPPRRRSRARSPAGGSRRRRGRRARPRAARRRPASRSGSSRCLPRRPRGVSFTCVPVSSSATSSRSSPIRSFGPGRSPRTATSCPAFAEASRIASIVPAWRSRSAWEKLSLKTSTPASISCVRTGGSQLAGPTVAMIFVRRPSRFCGSACIRTTVDGRRCPLNMTSICVTLLVDVRRFPRRADPEPSSRRRSPRRRSSRSTPPAQILRFNQRQIQFVFGARRRLGETFRMRTAMPGGLVIASHPDHVRSLFTANPELAPSLAAESPLAPIVGPNSVLTALGPSATCASASCSCPTSTARRSSATRVRSRPPPSARSMAGRSAGRSRWRRGCRRSPST